MQHSVQQTLHCTVHSVLQHLLCSTFIMTLQWCCCFASQQFHRAGCRDGISCMICLLVGCEILELRTPFFVCHATGAAERQTALMTILKLTSQQHRRSKGALETSTYSAEFMAMRHAVEEVASLRYMLRSLGVKVDSASHVYGDNLWVIQNATIKDSLLKNILWYF